MHRLPASRPRNRRPRPLPPPPWPSPTAPAWALACSPFPDTAPCVVCLSRPTPALFLPHIGRRNPPDGPEYNASSFRFSASLQFLITLSACVDPRGRLRRPAAGRHHSCLEPEVPVQGLKCTLCCLCGEWWCSPR